tara:strand:- start:91 stop:672 length:582 start_codon:yes stop_codon:yes gene_type:complete
MPPTLPPLELPELPDEVRRYIAERVHVSVRGALRCTGRFWKQATPPFGKQEFEARLDTGKIAHLQSEGTPLHTYIVNIVHAAFRDPETIAPDQLHLLLRVQRGAAGWQGSSFRDLLYPLRFNAPYPVSRDNRFVGLLGSWSKPCNRQFKAVPVSAIFDVLLQYYGDGDARSLLWWLSVNKKPHTLLEVLAENE